LDSENSPTKNLKTEVTKSKVINRKLFGKSEPKDRKFKSKSPNLKSPRNLQSSSLADRSFSPLRDIKLPFSKKNMIRLKL
jgi:hypothetical protein